MWQTTPCVCLVRTLLQLVASAVLVACGTLIALHTLKIIALHTRTHRQHKHSIAIRDGDRDRAKGHGHRSPSHNLFRTAATQLYYYGEYNLDGQSVRL